MKPALLMAALAMVLAACGSAPDREQPVSLDAAAAATAKAGTARSETVNVMEMGDRSWTTRSSGVHDYRRGRSELTSEFEGRRSRTIMIGEISYAELDAADLDPSMRGKRWVRHEALTEKHFEELNRDECDGAPGDEGEPAGEERDDLGSGCSQILLLVDSSLGGEDPGKMLDFLREYGSSLTVVDHEEVRGVRTTHLRTPVDFRRASEAWYEDRGWSRRNIERALDGQSREPAQVDVWVDGESLVRRVRTTRSHRPSGEFPQMPDDWGSSTSVTTTEYFDFGVEVDLQAPPASQVINWDEWWRTDVQSR